MRQSKQLNAFTAAELRKSIRRNRYLRRFARHQPEPVRARKQAQPIPAHERRRYAMAGGRAFLADLRGTYSSSPDMLELLQSSLKS